MNSVTTPKLPPPPRTAQKSSAFSSALAVTRSPSASTTSAASRLSIVRPYPRVRWPIPPPSVSPPTPVVEMIPHGTARPCSCVAASTSPQVAPPPTRTVRALGIDRDRVQQREIDDDAVVDAPEPAAVVTAAADRQGQVVRAGEGDHARHVVRARAARDHRRPLVDHRVEQSTRLVVARIAGPDQLALEPAPSSRRAAPTELCTTLIRQPPSVSPGASAAGLESDGLPARARSAI